MTVPGERAINAGIADAATRSQRLRLYLGGQASWYISLGIQFVIFPFLVTQVLHEPAARLGIAQMSLM
ncbi:MAG: hypothetical protein WBG82_07270, partial [Parvibaculum sp.]|uniref:hypothetical protein n=1 Tax=Parvibaculum sp. TaxID=2024848 RepID=UPI003C796D0A